MTNHKGKTKGEKLKLCNWAQSYSYIRQLKPRVYVNVGYAG